MQIKRSRRWKRWRFYKESYLAKQNIKSTWVDKGCERGTDYLVKRARPVIVGSLNGKSKPKKFAHIEHKIGDFHSKCSEKNWKWSSRVAVQSWNVKAKTLGKRGWTDTCRDCETIRNQILRKSARARDILRDQRLTIKKVVTSLIKSIRSSA